MPSYTLKLVKNLVDPQAANEFDCRERVYLMTTWFKVYGEHRITARWFNPEGALQDQGHLDFVAGSGISKREGSGGVHSSQRRGGKILRQVEGAGFSG